MTIKKYYYAFILALLFSFLLLAPNFSLAQASQTTFSVTPNYPSQQAPDVNGYYDLTVTNSEDIDLRFSLRNPSDKEIIITNTISPATTNKNGQIIYGPTKIALDASVDYNLADLITGEKETIVPAKSTTDLVLHLKSPTKEFQGIILGGIEFEEKRTDTDTQTIQNVIAYDIPILLRQNSQNVPLSFTFDKLNQNKQADEQFLTQRIYNSTPAIAKKGKLVTEIRRANTSEILYKETNNEVNFAPNSTMDFEIPLTDPSLSNGNYTAKTIIQFGEQKWETTASFTITGNTKRHSATSNIENKKTIKGMYPLVILMLIAVIVLLLYKNKKSLK